MTALLLLGLLLIDPPPPEPEARQAERQDESIVRPAVPVPEAGFPRELRDSRPPEWGFTAAVGMGAIIDGREEGAVVWGGVRRWVGPNAIVGGLVSFQHFSNLTDLALLARFELATRTDRIRLFPSFSAYVGAGPELFSSAVKGTSGGMRLVVGLHLPTIWSGLYGQVGPVNDIGLAMFLLLPTAIEVQFRTGGGQVSSSTAIVLALAL